MTLHRLLSIYTTIPLPPALPSRPPLSPPSPSRPSRDPVSQILTCPTRANCFTTGLVDLAKNQSRLGVPL